jgi:hypothetical protein
MAREPNGKSRDRPTARPETLTDAGSALERLAVHEREQQNGHDLRRCREELRVCMIRREAEGDQGSSGSR